MKATGSALSTWRSLPPSEKEEWKQQWTDLMAAFKAGLDGALSVSAFIFTERYSRNLA